MIREREDVEPGPAFPVFKAKRVRVRIGSVTQDMLKVICGRRSCEGVFLVPPAWGRRYESKTKPWKKFKTRACPHCMRAGRLPRGIK